ncbi:MAG: hypothetical protein PHI52_06415 [Bacteroidales bacterium]|nr:hypothetical protein [Bacteroidales bacterium]
MRPYISIYTDDPKKIINLKNLLSIESNNYYPLVYIPEQIKNKILNDDFYYVSDNTIINEYGLSNYSPIKPIRPTMPKEPDNYKYVEGNTIKFKTSFLGIISILVTIFWGYVTFIVTEDASGYENILSIMLLIVFIFSLIVSIKINSYYEKTSWRRELYPPEIKILKEKYEIEKKNYENNMINYNKKMTSYDSDLIRFQNKIKPKKVQYIYERYLREIKSKITFNRSNDIIKKGANEDSFLKYLIKAFPSDELKINMAVNTYKSSFYPDFLYVSKDNGFIIDIEIDERYDFEKKIPIHYINSDDERNNYFLEQNCFIIRFAEEQIIEQPENCCMFIKEVINVISSPQTYNLCTVINKIKPWTYEEAYLQAKDNTRRNY